jgi:hypothetical protein
MSAHTEEEKKEYSKLKVTLYERGFLIKTEQERWKYLFDKLAQSFKTNMNKHLEKERLEISN